MKKTLPIHVVTELNNEELEDASDKVKKALDIQSLKNIIQKSPNTTIKDLPRLFQQNLESTQVGQEVLIRILIDEFSEENKKENWLNSKLLFTILDKNKQDDQEVLFFAKVFQFEGEKTRFWTIHFYKGNKNINERTKYSSNLEVPGTHCRVHKHKRTCISLYLAQKSRGKKDNELLVEIYYEKRKACKKKSENSGPVSVKPVKMMIRGKTDDGYVEETIDNVDKKDGESQKHSIGIMEASIYWEFKERMNRMKTDIVNK